MANFNKLYGRVGKMLPGTRDTAMAAGKKAAHAAPIGKRKTSGQAAMNAAYIQGGKRATRIAAGGTVVAGAGAMRPKSHESRTAYRGPMQTGRGVGRYA